MARALKEKREKELETQGTAEVEVIEDLESQGDLKKAVPVGGEEFENEEPRQGE